MDHNLFEFSDFSFSGDQDFGNLKLKVKKKTLLKEFKKFGEVESVRIHSLPIQDTKKPRKGAILAKKINDSADRYCCLN